MDYQTENLILHFVTEDDISEVARTWPADHHPLSDAEAREAIAHMGGNYARNTKGRIGHLCLAVCGKDSPGTIMGWCGLDGSRNPAEPEIFILLDEPYRGKRLRHAVREGIAEDRDGGLCPSRRARRLCQREHCLRPGHGKRRHGAVWGGR